MTNNKIIALLLALLSLIGCSELEFKEGRENFLSQDYRSAFIRLMPSARKGVSEAQYAIGYMYYTGQGTVQNRKLAIEWISKAAKQGNKDAVAALNRLDNTPSSPYQPSQDPKLQPF